MYLSFTINENGFMFPMVSSNVFSLQSGAKHEKYSALNSEEKYGEHMIYLYIYVVFSPDES